MQYLGLLEKYAKLTVEIGANVQKDQLVWVYSSTETRELARLIVEACYKVGAKKVVMEWEDPYVDKYGYENMSIETLEEVGDWIVDRHKDFVDKGGCTISITSPIPGLNAGIDPVKMQKAAVARISKMKFFQTHFMNNGSQWVVVAAPNQIWAEKVFPDLKAEEAVDALWKAILDASRVTKDNDPVEEWEVHNKRLVHNNEILNKYQFESLHFENGLGTDLHVELIKNHIWCGGQDDRFDGLKFSANIPTEENFTMPYKYGVNGKVYGSKPLDYQGKLIENFWIEFKDGKAIDFGAEKNVDTLKTIIEFDEGSCYLGEVALVNHDSPISQSGILFYNTLFDENASCHLALGRAYPMNVEGGTTMSQDELENIGCNTSMAHCDFMFGSADMKITGKQKDGTKVIVFEKGNFVI